MLEESSISTDMNTRNQWSYYQILECHGPLRPSGCAYGIKIAFEQEQIVLCSISHVTMKHTLAISL